MTINTFEVHERYFQKGPIRVQRARKPNSRTKQQQVFKLNDNNNNNNICNHFKKQQRSVSVAGAAIAQPPEVSNHFHYY
jgi:hypothetical protein